MNTATSQQMRSTLTQIRIRASFAVALLLAMQGLAFAASDHNDQKPIVAMDTDPTLREPLLSALEALGEDYVPRTEHLLEDGSPKYVNRLILEDSPYLRQHAHNPVNWYPWGDEAFAAAKRDDKPIFLSIGYATCHWCHVMERESFENEEIANRMNAHYIAIKVDREQLPDVDSLFMSAVMLINGSGGWPMSSFVDTEGRPFFGGTYFPPDHFATLLDRVAVLWATNKPTLIEQASQIASAVELANQVGGEAREIGQREIDRALAAALQRFDPELGGFGGAPKFPSEPTLYYLLEQAQRTGNRPALSAAHFSLQRMAAGGIHDQVGGGFHRYSVDSRWLVPHFEKMLYNQAALSRNYAKAAQLTGDADHARTARRTLDYVLREMTSPEGTFYSATDADSEGEEGRFFVWTREQLEDALGPEDAKLAEAVWNITDEANFEGSNILHRSRPLSELAREQGLTEAALQAQIDTLAERLLAVRDRRERPLLDDKIITSWNGMMITALADASEALNEPRYLDSAVKAAEQLWRTMRKPEGGLWRTRFAGRSSIDATQADYAYLSEALLTLYDVQGDRQWLDRAIELTEVMLEQFWDAQRGGFFMGSQTVAGAALVSRPKDVYDNAIPSGNSVALRTLARLHKRTGTPKYGEYADKLIGSLSSRLAEQPNGFFYFLTGTSEHLLGESGARQYAANGVVKASAREQSGRVVVSIDLKPGWHINADRPLQDYLIPTQLSASGDGALQDVTYPQPVTRKLGFQRESLALYEGSVSVSAAMPALGPGQSRLPLSLRLQACNDEVCLPPESLSLTLPVARIGG